jgi:hypothetical protein
MMIRQFLSTVQQTIHCTYVRTYLSNSVVEHDTEQSLRNNEEESGHDEHHLHVRTVICCKYGHVTDILLPGAVG